MPYNHKIGNNNKLTPQQKHIVYARKRDEQIHNEDAEKRAQENKGEILLDWIDKNLQPIKSFNSRHTSYTLKGIVERDLDIYITEEEFKSAMEQSGYRVKDKNEKNLVYNISQKSKAFKKKA